MGLARSLERRLERLFASAAGRVFSGRIHPAELAAAIAREADLSRYRTESGPATANHYLITLSPSDLGQDPSTLEEQLAQALTDHARELGLLLEGPATVSIQTSDHLSPGRFGCAPSVVRGALPPWGRLVGPAGSFSLTGPRLTIGRSEEADVRLPHDSVSRRHAVMWRADGRAHVRDLGSANGTKVDGVAIGDRPSPLHHGSRVTFADQDYRYLEG